MSTADPAPSAPTPAAPDAQPAPASRVNDPESARGETRIVTGPFAPNWGMPKREPSGTLEADPLPPVVADEVAGLTPEQAGARLARWKSGMGDADWRSAWLDAAHPAHDDAVRLHTELFRVAHGHVAPRPAAPGATPAPGAPPADSPAGPESTSRPEGDEADPAVREAIAGALLAGTSDSAVRHLGADTLREEMAAASEAFTRGGWNPDEARQAWEMIVQRERAGGFDEETRAAASAEAERVLRQEWGERFGERLEMAREAARAAGLEATVRHHGLSVDPNAIRLLARVGERLRAQARR